MPDPLVSIVMPCYNAAASLPMALASLVAQTHPAWECILVDDGSADDPLTVAKRFDDPRIRYTRLPVNRGPGVARQVALDQAKGAYLGMLDADDWYYPRKLERQVALMEQDHRPVMVSAGLAVVDCQGDLVGVRKCGLPGAPPVLQGPWQRLAPVPMASQPVLIRMPSARAVRYDPLLLRSEDADFLLRVLWEQTYAALPEIAYVFRETAPAAPEKLLASYRYRMRVFWGYRRQYPAAAMANVVQALAKQTLHRLALAAGLSGRLVARRSRPPTPLQIDRFNEARNQVRAVARAIFPE